MRSPVLFDPYGRPASSFDFFQGGKINGPRDRPIAYYEGANDTEELLPTANWRQLLSSGRFLFANVPLLRGALLEQASYSFPLMAQYTGRDKTTGKVDRDWGKIAEEWLYEWEKDCNVRGRPYTAHTGSRIRMLGRKVDGDFGTILTWRSKQDTFPQVQYIRAHRIGDRNCDYGLIKTGEYKGFFQCNGVIQNDQGRHVAFRVLGPTPADDQDIPASSMFLTYRPDYADQARGISELCGSITAFADVDRLRAYEMTAQQQCAAVTFVEKSESGTADMAAEALRRTAMGESAADTSDLVRRVYDKGMTVHVRSGLGNGLEAFRSSRPAADAQAWEDKIVTSALYSIEWDANFAIAIKEPGGAWARTVIQKIIRGIANNVAIEAEARRLEAAYAIARAIELKILPAPKNGDWFSWEFSLGIPLITADSGNEENAQREAYKLGLTTLRAIAGRQGNWWEELRDQRQAETEDLLRRAREVQAEFPELTLQECLNLFEQRTPNGPPPQAPESETSSKPPTEKAA